ncbi:MAG: 2-C-methyl-D-erythritol 4-phosphate cytidylyltransferase, partial [Muribaculaceae bacterium]|nr:2-C-methyl-D-erythritol 4-phosphate cytidylyltransferase [Muribaculaceae bacterium]
MASVNVIIVAAGSGLRFGAPLPKQFCNLNGRPVVMTTIEALRSSLSEARLTLVINPDMEDLWLDLCSKHNFKSPEIIHGGATRWESVRNAIIKSDKAEIILVHDAVRPMISDKIIKPLMSA